MIIDKIRDNSYSSFWTKLTAPSSRITDPHHRRNARLLASLLLLSLFLLLLGRLLRPFFVSIPETAFASATVWLNIVVTLAAYYLSRTTHYQIGAVLAVVTVSLILYFQVAYRAYLNLNWINTTAVWVIPLLFISSLVLSWQATLALAIANLTALLMLPQVVSFVTLQNVRPSLEIITTASLMIIVTSFLRQRDLQRMAVQTRQLLESENRYRTLMEASSEAVLVHDDGKVIDVSESFINLFGYTQTEIMEKHVMELVAPESVPTVHEKMGVDYPYEMSFLHKDGRRIHAEIRVKRITYQGRLVRVVAMHDMTGRKQAEAQKMELIAERERSTILQQFIQDASHDLRTPLTTMTTSLYLLRRKTAEVDEAAPYLDRLDEQVNYLTEMLEELFVMSRLDDPTLYLERGSLDVNMIVNDLAGDHRRIAAAKGQTLRFEPTADLPLIVADHSQLSRCVTQLLDNAVTYTPDGGKITIRTRLEAGNVVIEVEDTGMGISPDDLPHIFKRFYRADQARQAKGAHSGLGLAITQKIIDIHGGSIQVDSVPGQGSTFRIYLPAEPMPKPLLTTA
jgi:PAS domain S-box-containing protein